MDGLWWLIVVGVALWLATMGLVATLPIAPRFFLRLAERLVCPPGTKMEVNELVYSYHRPGERAIDVRCVGPGLDKDVKVKALLALWGIYLIPSLPLAALIVMLTSAWL